MALLQIVKKPFINGLLTIFCMGLVVSTSKADVISIIIDDIGYSHTDGWMAIALPNAVTLSILPDAPFANTLGEQANIAGHETMLHIPMQANQQAPHESTSLNSSMSESQLKTSIADYIQQFPLVSGLNNHMGSQLTASSLHMGWIMQAIKAHTDHDLFFVDSRTTTETQAQLQAQQHNIPTTRRDVFIDNSQDPIEIKNQLMQLKLLARKNGFALGIAHPHKSTLRVLHAELPKLIAEGIELVPVSEYIQRKQMEQPIWQLSSYPSPQVARN